MIRPAILVFASMSALIACAACASPGPSSETLLAARLLADQPVDAKKGEGAGDASRRPVHRAAAPVRRSHSAATFADIAAANRSAVREPARDFYVGAAQIYPWTEGALYRLYTAPTQVSDIALQPGENLISVAAGDSARWLIGDTTSGSGAEQRTHILVKPAAAGLSTNLVIATDRRVYHVQLESSASVAMASISWTYPQGALIALKRVAEPAPKAPVAHDIPVETLDFGYRIEGDDPPWRPLRAFDDGRQVYIEFPPTLAEGEAPPLFIRGDGGRIELVNYRVRGHYYVVDRLFSAAELRLGEKRQQVVRIVRADALPRPSAS